MKSRNCMELPEEEILDLDIIIRYALDAGDIGPIDFIRYSKLRTYKQRKNFVLNLFI